MSSSFFNSCSAFAMGACSSHALSEGGAGCPVPSLSSSNFFKVKSLSDFPYTFHILSPDLKHGGSRQNGKAILYSYPLVTW